MAAIIHLASYPYVPARHYPGDGWEKKSAKNRYKEIAGVIHPQFNKERVSDTAERTTMSALTATLGEMLGARNPAVTPAVTPAAPDAPAAAAEPTAAAPAVGPTVDPVKALEQLSGQATKLLALAEASKGASQQAVKGLLDALTGLEGRFNTAVARQQSAIAALNGGLTAAAASTQALGQAAALQAEELKLFALRMELSRTREILTEELKIADQSWHLRNPEAAIGIAAGTGLLVGFGAGVGAAIYFGWGSTPIDTAAEVLK